MTVKITDPLGQLTQIFQLNHQIFKMKKTLLFYLLSFYSIIGFSQIGLTSGIQFFQATTWENHLQTVYGNSEIAVFNPTVYAGIDYWLRLKNKRIEFTPELAFASYQTQVSVDRLPDVNEVDQYRANYYSLFLNTNFYILDFDGDCNCPTFNKDGDVIKKGFFLRISPAIHYTTQQSKFEVETTATSWVSEEFNFGLRAGAGIDIGISSFITLTPLVMGTYNLPSTWLQFGDFDLENIPQSTDNAINLFAGLRLGLRFDELNKYGYR